MKGKSMVKRYICVIAAITVLLAVPCGAAGELAASASSVEKLTNKAWEALSQGDHVNVVFYADKCIELYKDEAQNQQRSLTAFPASGDADKYITLNNVATSIFIKGESLFKQRKFEEAKACYNVVVDKYGFAQYWDPKGWYWKVAEKSQAIIDKIDAMLSSGSKKEVEEKKTLIEGLNFPLFDEGFDGLIDYAKYGEFRNVGTPNYAYVVKDRKSLAKAVGEGIFPNNSIYRDPLYKKYQDKGLLEGDHWNFVNSDNLQASFYKWAAVGEDPGVKMYYVGHILERAMHYKQAIKAYYAVLLHYPKTISWTYWKTPWYVGEVAIDRIKYLTRKHPELGIKLIGADLIVENGFDVDVTNDIISVNPGKFVKCSPEDLVIIQKDISELKIIKTIGGPKSELVQYENRDWQFRIDGLPTIIKAVAYAPVTIGQSPDNGTLRDWTFEDYNQNGKIDGPYDTWVDANLNNKKDPGEEAVGDFKLLKDMGANAIRVYHHERNRNDELFLKGYNDYGLMVLMGDFLGAYAAESGADWHEGTDYSNPVHQENMKKSVRKMVTKYKDKSYVIMWVLGNENNYGVANNAKKDPVSYFKFVNDVAKMIKSMDPTRPIVVCNGDVLYLDIFAKYAQDVDVYGCNSYRGEQGFGIGVWNSVKRLSDKPILITEYGCPAYQKGRPREIIEVDQAIYHQGEWEDIFYNTAGYGAGNSLGGVIFEWLDEWWKAYDSNIHDTEALYSGPFPGGWVYEEWFGIVGQGNGSKSPFMRQLRESYFLYKKMWNQ